MNRRLWIPIGVAGVLALCLLSTLLGLSIGRQGAGPSSVSAESNSVEYVNRVTVTGMGAVSVTSDIPTVFLTISSLGQDTSLLIEEVAEALEETVETAAGYSLTEEDISTTRYSLDPVTNYSTGRDTGQYRYSVAIQVQGLTLENASKFVADLLGNDLISNARISLSYEPDQSYTLRALELAREDALAKAEALYGGGGYTVISLTEKYVSSSNRYNVDYSTAAMSSATAGAALYSGSDEVSATVELVIGRRS